MKPKDKSILIGIFTSLCGAYVWGVIHIAMYGGNAWMLALFMPVFLLMAASWYVVPIGIVLGIIMPALIINRSLRSVLLLGITLGCVAGSIAALCTVGMFEWPSISGRIIITNKTVLLTRMLKDFLQALVAKLNGPDAAANSHIHHE
jgi:hypothetical protein